MVVFLVDDLGWTDLRCCGSDLYQTPHIDRLAASGMRFTDAYAACTVCSPTRAALMTGMYPARLNLTDWIDDVPADPTVHDVYLRLFARSNALDNSTTSNATINNLNTFVTNFTQLKLANPCSA